MGENLQKQNRRRALFGCLGLAAVALLLVGGALIGAFYIDRQAAQFPNSRYISQHSNYSLPRYARWDDSYASQETISTVFNWYSTTFDLGTEKQANGNCTFLEDTKRYGRFERYMSVLICDVGNERQIYVNRATSIR